MRYITSIKTGKYGSVDLNFPNVNNKKDPGMVMASGC